VNGCKILFQKRAKEVLPALVLAGCWGIRGQRVIGTSTRITGQWGPGSFQQMGNKCDVPEASQSIAEHGGFMQENLQSRLPYLL
jgi:hypothetical protein